MGAECECCWGGGGGIPLNWEIQGTAWVFGMRVKDA